MKKIYILATLLFITTILLVACSEENDVEEYNDNNKQENEMEDNNDLDTGVEPTEKEETSEDDDNVHEGNTNDETAVETDAVDDRLNLPELYENTVIYHGTLNPVFPWYIKFPGEDEGELLDVNEGRGRFSIVLASKDFKEGDEITFYVAGGEANENMVRTVNVQPTKDGKEIVESEAETHKIEEEILDQTTIKWEKDTNSVAFEIETIEDVETSPFYSYKAPVNETSQMEDQGDNMYRAILPSQDDVQPGDKIQIYITALGVTAVKEMKIPEDIAE